MRLLMEGKRRAWQALQALQELQGSQPNVPPVDSQLLISITHYRGNSGTTDSHT